MSILRHIVRAGAVFVPAIGLVFAATTFAANSPPVFLTMWGVQGGGDGQFDHPFSVALAADGLLYIADQHNERVVVYTREGAQVFEFPVPGPAPGSSPDPTGIAYNPSNALLYVSEHHTHRISVFTTSGGYVQSFNAGVVYPVEVACDAAGFVYIASSGTNEVVKCAPDGTPVLRWGVSGTPYGITLDAAGTLGNVYVTGYDNHEVRKFTSDGTFVTSWGGFGTGEGQFRSAEGMWADGAGDLYVCDTGNNRIQEFTIDGEFLLTWGSLGNGPGEFYTPTDIVGDVEGNLYIIEWNNSRVQKFSVALATPVAARSWGGVKARYR